MNAERMNMANATAKIEGSKELVRPAGSRWHRHRRRFLSVRRTDRQQMTRRAGRHRWRQTSRGQRPPAGFLPQWESCHWLRICILLSS